MIRFARVAHAVSNWIGSPGALIWTCLATGAWIAWGCAFGFSDTMMSWMGAATGIVSILLLIMLQHSSSHDARALGAKIDELIRVTGDARNQLIGLEDKTDAEIEALRRGIAETCG